LIVGILTEGDKLLTKNEIFDRVEWLIKGFYPRTIGKHTLNLLGKYYVCMMDTKKKQAIIKKFQTHEGDTGSSEVQIAILSAEIDELINHLKTHPKDHSSRRGLLRKVSARRSLMRYIKKENPESYERLAKKLKLKSVRAIVKPGTAKATEDETAGEEAEVIEKENEIVNG